MFKFLQSEKKVRHLWFLFLVLPIFTYVISWFFLAASLHGDSPFILSLKKVFAQPWVLVLGLIFRLIIVWLFTHCSYRKKGTALLSFTAWVYPASMAYAFYSSTKGLFNLQEGIGLNDPSFAQFVAIGATVGCIDLVLNLCWYFLCFHLRNFNRQLQFDKVSETAKYLDAFYTLQNNSNLKQLKYKYLLAKQKYPEVRYVFKMEYQEQKDLLKNSMQITQ